MGVSDEKKIPILDAALQACEISLHLKQIYGGDGSVVPQVHGRCYGRI